MLTQPAILYVSKRGHTRQVVEQFDLPKYDLGVAVPDLTAIDPVILFCPTYGNEELPEEMERFLNGLSRVRRSFAACELGNYYGFDDLEFGALKIIRPQLLLRGWTEIMRSLSLDSLPRINWPELMRWKEELHELLRQRCGGPDPEICAREQM
jgi:hypothetical protein